MATILRFEDLEIWQLARKLCVSIYKQTNTGEFARDFQLKDQIKRSSGSIMDNIAEGFGRGGNKELINFLSIAKGSCSETRSQLYRAFDYGYINKGEFEKLNSEAQIIIAKIQSFINHLKQTSHRGPKFRN